MTAELRAIPSVHAVLVGLGVAPGDPVAASAVRTVLSAARATVRAGGSAPSLLEVTSSAAAELARVQRPPLRRVINASGVILQTNLGRAPLSERALGAIATVARGYSDLEYDIEAGARGSRHDILRPLLRQVTGAEDGIVVNNNAAAVFMVLQVLAAGREVVVSRGQAVEIGGGFRIPDVMREAGARLVEVGTTNRTYARDYESAITADTAALLRVHPSNFRVVGFAVEPAPAELALVAAKRSVLLIDDLGSGCLLDTTAFGLAHEPTVQESLTAGADLALFSGDKLLGGPQAGVIVGRADLIDRLRRHPLARALRVDKLTIAALGATLQAYAEGSAASEIPVWRMASAPLADIGRRARRWARAGGGDVVAARTMVGGGSLPGEGVPTWCAALAGDAGPDALASALRANEPAIVPRIEGGRVLLDPRTVAPGDDAAVLIALARQHG